MATRFGGSSPVQTYAARVRWIVGCLVAIILVLVATLYFVARSGMDEPAVDSNDAIAAVNNAPEEFQDTILYSISRIEAGAPLSPEMFIEQAVARDRVPADAVRAQDRHIILKKFAKNLINANMPLLHDDYTDMKPISIVTDNIPPGYRAVTITVDSRSGVEGWARPNTRVDVLWTYTDKQGSKKVATIVHFSKILSVGGATGAGEGTSGKKKKGGITTATLLVTEIDAKRIELARSTGKLSLSLVGTKETGEITSSPEPIDIGSLLPRAAPAGPAAEPAPDGVMYAPDPKTGKRVKYVLRNGRWKKDRSEE